MDKPEKILLVDDRPENLVSLEAVLDGLGVEMHKALSGKEALRMAFKDNYSLILLDVQMPGMDGFEVAGFLKKTKKTRETPIIFITAISKEDKHVSHGYATGAVDYIFKPFNPHILLAKVNVFLQLEEQKRELRLAKNRIKLTEEVLNSASEGVLITNRDGVIQAVNPAFSVITGYAAEEVIGRRPNILKSNHHDKQFYEKLWQGVIADGKWHGEIWNRRRDGEAYPQLTSITAVKEYDNTTSHYIGIFSDISDKKRNEEELRYQADHDALTGLPNRNLFLDRLRQAMAVSRGDCYLGVVVFGIDFFKKINDSLGPNVGDDLLRELARRSRELFGERHSFSRLGGDEFGFLLDNLGHLEDVAVFWEQNVASLFRSYSLAQTELHISASAGFSLAPLDAEDPMLLFKNAGLAMHRAKENGRGQYQFFGTAMGEEAARRLHLENEMRLALEKGDFQLFYQPKVDLRQGNVVGMEALIRWQHHEFGFVSPLDFIPVAEETGLIIPLGRWIMDQACRDAKHWLDQGHDLKISVNLSVKQFQDPGLIEAIEQALRANALPPENFEAEVTESMMMGNMVQIIETLRQLKGLGISVSVDDFGTGYSSLSYLKKLPVDVLKIDQSFIRELTPDSEDAAIVEAIIAMGKSLKLGLIAEGVEERAHVDFLQARGCDQMQGYYFSKPLSAQDFTALLAAGKKL